MNKLVFVCKPIIFVYMHVCTYACLYMFMLKGYLAHCTGIKFFFFFCIVLYCFVLYCIILYYIVLYCIYLFIYF